MEWWEKVFFNSSTTTLSSGSWAPSYSTNGYFFNEPNPTVGAISVQREGGEEPGYNALEIFLKNQEKEKNA